ncbi:MAG: tetratricopeptide repeat protein [Acidobacteria bacterium]|nr:tetratricopeptide repeat protein [Acidobacteriota bacterium]
MAAQLNGASSQNQRPVANFKNFRLLAGSAGKSNAEAKRLDQFLTGLADPGLIGSLKREEQGRHRRLAVLTLLAGVLLGASGFWLALDARKTANDPPSKSAVETARTLVTHGSSLAWSKELPKALRELRLATELAPGMVEAWDALAIAYFYSGQTHEAVRCWHRCLAIEPGHERSFHNLGDIYFYSGRYQEAEDYWLKAHADRAVARVRLLEGRTQEAIPLVHKLASERPDDRWIQVMKQAVEGGQLTPYLRWRLEPGYLLSWDPETTKGWRLFYEERYGEASALFSQVLARHPGDGSALLGKGWCLQKIGSHFEARPYFERVLAKWPANYGALNGLGWALKDEKQTEGALKAWERVLDHRPDNVESSEARKGIGMVYYERGDYGRANLYLSECVLKNSEDKEAAKLLAETARKLSPQ